jgi:hypothetical protein
MRLATFCIGTNIDTCKSASKTSHLYPRRQSMNYSPHSQCLKKTYSLGPQTINVILLASSLSKSHPGGCLLSLISIPISNSLVTFSSMASKSATWRHSHSTGREYLAGLRVDDNYKVRYVILLYYSMEVVTEFAGISQMLLASKRRTAYKLSKPNLRHLYIKVPSTAYYRT